MLCLERQKPTDCHTESEENKEDSKEFLLNNSIDNQATVSIDNIEESEHDIWRYDLLKIANDL